MDNDDTITGIGQGQTTDVEDVVDYNTQGNGIPGIQTGGHADDGTPDTRGIMEKAADLLTGDRTDDKTAKQV